jgi:hypothetical protein
MLDLETIDTSPTAVVLTIGAVKFDAYDASIEPGLSSMYLRLNVDQQTALGRTSSEDTLAWWAKQSAAAQEEAFSEENRVDLLDFAKQLNAFTVGAEHIWANGVTFDITILENLYRMLGLPAPWNYWQIRDCRTIFDLGDDSAKTMNTEAHNAFADAYCQAKAVQNIYNELGIKKKAR